MALITCPECGRKISDRAPACVGCGIPMEEIRIMLKQNEMQPELQVKCLHCSNVYNTSAMKCPKCKYPLLVLFTDSGYINKSFRRAAKKADTDRLKGIKIKCVVCENEYGAAALKCPECKFPALALTGETDKQSGIIDSYKKANYPKTNKTDSIPEITKGIIEKEKDYFKKYSYHKEPFIRNMNKTLSIAGSGWKEHKPRSTNEIIAAKTDEVKKYSWNIRNKLDVAYLRNRDSNCGCIGEYYISWSKVFPYANYNLVEIDKQLALIKEEGYETSPIERKDILRILSGDDFFIEDVTNRLSEDYAFPAGRDAFEYEIACMMLRTLDDGTVNGIRLKNEFKTNNSVSARIGGVRPTTGNASQSEDMTDIRTLRPKAVKGDKQAMIKLADFEARAKEAALMKCSDAEKREQFEDLFSSLLEPVKSGSAIEELLLEAAMKIVKTLPMDEIIKGRIIQDMMVTTLARGSDAEEPLRGIDQDEIVARGAAVQEGFLAREMADPNSTEVYSLLHSISIETAGGEATKVIEKDTIIPTKKSIVISTSADNQTTVAIHVVQGECAMADDNTTLGWFNLSGIPPAKAGVPRIEITFEVDVNGTVNVKARDLGTGNEQKVTVSTAI